MRNYLYRRSEILASSLLVKYIPIYLTCGKVGELVKVFIDESLIVSEVKICLGSVVRNINLTMLVRAHCSGIHIDIRIKLLCCYLKSSCLQKTAQGCGGDAFSES